MMLGPMKKKIVTTGVVTFLIPTVVFGALFYMYSNKKNAEIDALSKEAGESEVYVFSGDLPINHVITSNDVKLVKAKTETVASNAYFSATYNGEMMALYKGMNMVGRKLKIPVQNQTMIVDSMFFDADDSVKSDIRTRELNMIMLPSDLDVGDYIDIRILFPTGEDYIVVTGAEIKQLGQTSEANTMFIDLSEEEMIRLSGAIIESYISDGINVYAVKYVNPNQQLFDEVHVDYVAEYEAAVKTLQEKYASTEEYEVSNRQEPMRDESGDIIRDEEGNIVYEETDETTELVQRVPTVEELDINEIAAEAGMKVEDAIAVQTALKNNDELLLGIYRNKTETIKTTLEETYPVRAEVAKLLANNPNILEEIRNEYNSYIDRLTVERETLIDTSVWTVSGEGTIYEELVLNEDAIKNIATNLEQEIERREEERKEYLQSLITQQAMTTTPTTTTN